MVRQIIAKMELIARMHKAIIGNVEEAQQKAKEDLCVVEREACVSKFCYWEGYGKDEETKPKESP